MSIKCSFADIIGILSAKSNGLLPERPEHVAELQGLAAQLQGCLEAPRLRWKYAWVIPVFGWKAAKGAQMALPQIEVSCIRRWDKAMYKLEARQRAIGHATHVTSAAHED